MDWVANIVVPAGVAMAGAITYLNKRGERVLARVEGKLDECETKHEAATQQIADIRQQLGVLEGRQEGVEKLAKQVLDVVKDHNGHGD